MGVIAIPEGLGWGIIGVSEFVSVFGYLDYKDIWVICKDEGVFGEEGVLTIPGDEGQFYRIKINNTISISFVELFLFY